MGDCKGCKYLTEGYSKWSCTRHAPAASGFPNCGTRCGDYVFDEDAAALKAKGDLEYAWGQHSRERLLRWIAAGRPPMNEWTIPVVEGGDEQALHGMLDAAYRSTP